MNVRGGRSLPPTPLPVNEGDERTNQGVTSAKSLTGHQARPLSSSCCGHTHTHTTAGTWTRTTHTTHMSVVKRKRGKKREKGMGERRRGRSLPPPLPVNEGDEREKGWGQCTRHGRCQNRGHNRRVVVVLSVSHTHTPPPTRGHGQHTRHTCHTGQWASIPHRRDAASTCGASWNGTTRVNGYTKNGEYPGGRRWGWNWTTGPTAYLK